MTGFKYKRNSLSRFKRGRNRTLWTNTK